MTDFVCHVREELDEETREDWRKACEGLNFYGEHEGKRYCVLHFPEKGKEADFEDALAKKFEDEEFDFRGVYFPKSLSFASLLSNATFESEALFSRAVFEDRANFRGVTFKEGADFFSATFKGEVDFLRTDFRGPRYFSNATSLSILKKEYVTFSKATFKRRTVFFKATFEGRADFSKATFEGQAVFSSVTFEGQAGFSDATFRGADFTKARFKGTSKPRLDPRTTDFRRATFGGELYFKEAEFKGYTDFYRANFLDAVKFIGGEKDKDKKRDGNDPSLVFPLEEHVSFSRARIEKPELFSFYAILLRPSWFVSVDTRKFDFTDVTWHGMLGAKGTLDEELSALEKHTGVPPHNLLAQACRRLSANAEENREYPLANEFHYWSMDALRKRCWSRLKGLTPNSLTKKETWRDIREHFGLITTLYWALSGYGVRAGRAFWMLAAIWAAFTILYVLVDPSEFKDFGQGIGYRWQAAVYSLLALVRLNPEPRPEEPGIFQFLVGLEGILGPLHIALCALAIRRKVMR